MFIGDTEFNKGDPISYIRYTNGHNQPKHRQGIIEHVTDSIITVNLGKYRDSFTLQDLVCGVVKIPGLPKIKLTTSETKKPYRNPVRAELLRELERDQEEDEKEESLVRHSIEEPSADELRRVFADGKQSIKFVQDFYKVSKTTARKWLIKAGLLVNKKDQKQVPNQKKAESPGLDIDKVHNLPQFQNNTVEPKPASIMVYRHANGTIDWALTGPLVKAEIDKGRDKYELAAELGITKASMKKYMQTYLSNGETKPKVVKPAADKTDEFEQLRGKTREELLAMRAQLQATGLIIDVILSCIDKTLKGEAKKNAAV